MYDYTPFSWRRWIKSLWLAPKVRKALKRNRRNLALEPLEDRVVPANNLVAAYNFDAGSGTALADVSGNGNTGTISNASWSSSGKFGGALSFSGSTDSLVTIADAPSLDLSKGMTLEAWVDPTSLKSPDAGWAAAVAKEHKNSTDDVSYALYGATGTGTGPGSQALVGSDQTAASSSPLTLNQWAFLATTFNGSVLRTYVNGTLVASRSVSGSILSTTDPLVIGGDASGEMFTGLIDNVRIYNIALSQSAIKSDMSSAVSSAGPTVTITSPAPGAIVSHTITVSAGVSSAVTSVQLVVDGSAVGTAVKTAPYNFTLDTTALTTGTHTLAVRATDSSGKTTTSAPISVTVDNTPPMITVTSPAPGLATNSNATVTGQVTDDLSGVASLQAAVDGGSYSNVSFDSGGNFSFTTALKTDGSADGTHTVHLRATDGAGNASAVADVSFTLDTVAPQVTVTAPTPGPTTNTNVTVTGQTTDDRSGVASLQAAVDGGSYSNVSFDSGGNFSFTTSLALDHTAGGGDT
jgi:hypothetical protein